MKISSCRSSTSGENPVHSGERSSPMLGVNVTCITVGLDTPVHHRLEVDL